MSDTSISAVIAAAFADEADPVDDKGAGDVAAPLKVATAELTATTEPADAAPLTAGPTRPVAASDLSPDSSSKKRVSSSKSDAVLKKLRSARGVTVAQIMEATGWQAHSVRGFLSAVVRKKHGLSLSSEIGKDGQRRYRVVGADAGTGQRG